MEQREISVADLLAVERTRMANQRTLLAYLRTFIILLSSGLAVAELHMFRQISYLGFVLLGLSPVVLGIGLFNFNRMRKKLLRYKQ